MKTMMNLTDLASELTRRENAKRDFIAPNSKMRMMPTADISLEGAENFYGVTSHAHGQFASHLDIPKKYYDRMREEKPELLADNVNAWLDANGTQRRMVRTLDGDVRAYMSDRYRPLDNHDLAEASLQVLHGEGSNLQIQSLALTDTRMYIKAVTERIELEVKRGDPVQAGIVISNSEVGAGSVKIEPLVLRLVCTNGMIANDASLRKFHVGRAGGNGDDGITEFLRDETRQADDRAFWMKVQDLIRAAFDDVKFRTIVERMTASTEDRIEGDPVTVVDVTAKRFGLTEGERGGILNHLVDKGDLSRYGLLNAVTAVAQTPDDYERATELERLGGQILELPKSAWKEIATAA